jgi:hypothetical protein
MLGEITISSIVIGIKDSFFAQLTDSSIPGKYFPEIRRIFLQSLVDGCDVGISSVNGEFYKSLKEAELSTLRKGGLTENES